MGKTDRDRLGLSGVSFRHEVRLQDIDEVKRIVEATAYFNPSEVLVALELVQEHVNKGAAASGYYFAFAERGGRMIGYACFGPIPCTVSSYNLYWIVVHPDFQDKGVGKALMRETERLVRAAGGTRMYIDTSYKAQYEDTRAFYESLDYKLAALLPDYYSPGDAKVIYCKIF